MNLYCIKYLKFTKNNDFKINHKIVAKISLYSPCIDCGFKKIETINKK